MKKLFILLLFCVSSAYAQQTVQFPSADGLTITADLYETDKQAPYIVLCHLAGHSRAEYQQTAKKLNAMGFNCLAVDARSGNEFMGVVNQTAFEARKQNKPTTYLDALPDITAAVAYADALGGGRGVLLLGSSYSASLALKIAAEDPRVRAVAAFSPGEQFGDKLRLKDAISGLDKPMFVTSSREEAPAVTVLLDHLPEAQKQQFIPEGKGAHGSLALWPHVPNHQEYWDALSHFLTAFKAG